MVDPPDDPKGFKPKPPLGDTIDQRAERKKRAWEKRKHTAWFGLGMFGLVGWSVAIPTLMGIAIGVWLDSRFPGKPSWTLTFLIIGVALGCLNAWFWVKQESQRE